MGTRHRPTSHVAAKLSVTIDGRAHAWRELLLPSPDDAAEWWHPGLAGIADGRTLLFRQGGRQLLALHVMGTTVIARDLPLRIGHGITAEAGTDAIWIADPGLHARLAKGEIVRETVPGRVARIAPNGANTAELETPPLPVYRHEPYRPTSVALVGDQIWVADGYGQSLVHRFDAGGRHLGSIDGTGSGAHFNCPHALFVEPRHAEPLVWIADRGNAVLRAYDADGRLVRTLGAGTLTSPSGVAALGEMLVVAELSGRLALFDPDGLFLGTVGAGDRNRQEPGWPNRELDGRTARPDLRPERFNSPHAICARPDGSLVVAEWLLGGRLVELRPLPS